MLCTICRREHHASSCKFRNKGEPVGTSTPAGYFDEMRRMGQQPLYGGTLQEVKAPPAPTVLALPPPKKD